MKKSLYIVDIFSFIFRAYYAIRPLSASDGTPVNAVYGVITMMKKLIDTKKPDHLVVCMESKGKKTFRAEIFPEYKANRGAPPEDLIPQIGLIEEFVQSYPMKIISVPGFEADDVIASIVKQYCHRDDVDVYIVSPDKDLMQLVCGNVFLYDTMKEKIFKIPDVIEKFGVPPEKVVEVQSLCGDPTDNIPGIPGVGIKTATKLIQEYGDLENVLNATDIKGKIGEKVARGKASALLSRKLVSLAYDVPLDMTWEDLAFKPADAARLNGFYKRLGFKSLATHEATPTENPAAHTNDLAEFITIQNIDHLKKILAEYTIGSPFAFDTETDSLTSLTANLVGISFCFDTKKSYYIPIAHKSGHNLDLDAVRTVLGPVLANSNIPKVAQNAKFDMNVLTHHDFTIDGLADDTLIGAYLINPEGSHSLDTLAQKYLNHRMIAFGDVVKRGQNFTDVAIPNATRYSAEDAWAAFSILPQILTGLKDTAAEKVYRDIEIPLITILSNMERHGMLVDRDLLLKLDKHFMGRLKELEIEIYKSAGEEFNINSTQQLAKILFIKLGLPVIKKTKTGFSTDVDVLQALSSIHELPKTLLEYRMLNKLQSTYVAQLSELIDPKTNRVHTTFNQHIAATGRLSSTDPNMQNIPIKTPEGRKLRELFIAPKGYVVFSADYSQIELRLLAAFSKDPNLVEAYKHDQDIHRRTASHIFGVAIADVTDRQRTVGKTINFGVIYGQSAFGLAQMLGVPRDEAQHFINKFYEEFSRVKEYKEEVLATASRDGYVATYLGRRRYLPELSSQNKMNQMNAERAAFNAIFQGSAADLIKKAMIEITEWLTKEKLKARLVLQVHDELIFEVPENELETISRVVPGKMSGSFKLNIPLAVSWKAGKNWGEAH